MEADRRKSNPMDHLANERTFLAWVRTSIGIMAFGFVVVKFSLFVKQLSLIFDSEKYATLPVQHGEDSAIVGIILVVFGVLVLVMSYVRYRSAKKQLDNGFYKHSSLYITLLTGFITLISIVLVYYLIQMAQ